jgi:hypothetical protein
VRENQLLLLGCTLSWYRWVGRLSHEASTVPAEQQTRRHERWDQPQAQSPEPERPPGEGKKGKTADLDANDVRETSSVKEQSSRDNKKKEIRSRGRSYSASVQDVSKTKLHSPSPFAERTKEGALVDNGIRDLMRGRAYSSVRRDARSLEFDRIVDDRSTERSRSAVNPRHSVTQ